jgi:hypothetical protein
MGQEETHVRRFKTVRPHLSPHDLALEQCGDDLELVSVRVREPIELIRTDPDQPNWLDAQAGFLAHLVHDGLINALAQLHRTTRECPLSVVGTPYEPHATAIVLDKSTRRRHHKGIPANVSPNAVEEQAGNIMVGVSVAMAVLGGAWWLIDIGPPPMQALGHLFPSAWAMDAFQANILQGATASDVVLETGVLLGYTVLSSARGVGRLKLEVLGACSAPLRAAPHCTAGRSRAHLPKPASIRAG